MLAAVFLIIDIVGCSEHQVARDGHGTAHAQLLPIVEGGQCAYRAVQESIQVIFTNWKKALIFDQLFVLEICNIVHE
jgi:hypothetical protein